jgi:hypothetical protein
VQVVKVLILAEEEVKPPTLLGGLAPQAIRAAVLEEERAGFERQYREAMAEAADTCDLTRVTEVLRAWQRIAELTARDGRTGGGSWSRPCGSGATAITPSRTRCAAPASSTSCCGNG